MEDGYALAFGSIYQGGCYYSGWNTVPAVFKTTDNGANWSRFSLSTYGGNIYSIAVDPDNPDIVYAGGYYYLAGDNAALYKTTDGGINWTEVGGSFSSSEIHCVSIDPNDHNRILAGTDAGVYISSDAGTNWTAPLLDVDVHCMVPNPATSSIWFIGTSNGVYRSLDGGIHWIIMNDGLLNTDIQSMDLDAVNRILYAGTDGSGVFRYDLVTNVDIDNSGIPEEVTLHQNFPNPFNMQTEIVYELPVNGKVTLAVYNVQGRRIRILVDSHQTSGKKVVSWDGRDLNGNEVSSGMYIYRIKTQNTVDMKKMILQK
ncbi:T9SS type A sorting domain-containing protein [bacterium]